MSDKTSASLSDIICAIMAEVGYIEKKGTNKFHNYKYATIEDVMKALQPAMAEHKLAVIQNEVSREIINNVLYIKYEFTLIADGFLHPGGSHTGSSNIKTNKGDDDKGANKCHVAARKYYLLGLFNIPTGLDSIDTDQSSCGSEKQPPTTEKTDTDIAKAREKYKKLVKISEDVGDKYTSEEFLETYKEDLAFIKKHATKKACVDLKKIIDKNAKPEGEEPASDFDGPATQEEIKLGLDDCKSIEDVDELHGIYEEDLAEMQKLDPGLRAETEVLFIDKKASFS